MFKRAIRYVFFVAVYLSGIVIGGIYTPHVMTYAKEMNAQKELEQQEIQQKPQRIKKKITRINRLG